MSGARGRPHKIPKSQTYNLTFSIDQVKKVRKRAKKLGVSAPTLIREAVKAYLEDGAIETKPVSSDGWFLGKYPEKEAELSDLAGFFGFKDGVEDALEALKKEFTHTKYASGKTLGEVAAERVEERLRKEKKYGIPPPERGDGWGEQITESSQGEKGG